MLSVERLDMTGPMHFEAEKDAEQWFDDVLDESGWFTTYKEVVGSYLHPRPLADVKVPRIDRLLIPTRALIEQGWTYGAIGVEIKRSGLPLGRPVSQIMDYTRAVFRLCAYGDMLIMPSFIFLFPAPKQGNAMSSVMTQNRIGTATPSVYRGIRSLRFRLGEISMLDVSEQKDCRIGDIRSGNKTGSR